MAVCAILMIDVAPSDAVEPVGGWDSTVHAHVPDELTLSVTDLAASRGDGVFETLGVVAGHAQAVEAHLNRLAASARILDIAQPNIDQWRAALARAEATLPVDRQGGLKLVLTRGVEGRGEPTAWITASTMEQSFAQRRQGVRAVTLDRGYSIHVARDAPWLLAGAKTLSYAVNMAALREAERRGADDVIFLSAEGYVLEGPTSSVVLRFGRRIVTPRTDTGILPGTSQSSLFEHFRREGYEASEQLVTLEELRRADGAWLVSSVRLATAITHIDGAALHVDADLTDRMNEALLGRTH